MHWEMCLAVKDYPPALVLHCGDGSLVKHLLT